MSYSRWGDRGSGYWYTFWSANPNKDGENYDNAVFEVCMIKAFTAKELRGGIDRCLNVIDNLDPKAGSEKLEELGAYMNEFLNDVDNEYLGGNKEKCSM